MKTEMDGEVNSTFMKWLTRLPTNTTQFMEFGFRARRSGSPKLVMKMVYVPMEMQGMVLSLRNPTFKGLSTTP